MKNIWILILLFSYIICIRNNLNQDTEPIDPDKDVVLKGPVAIIAACRIACGSDKDCLIKCIQASNGTLQEDVKQAEVVQEVESKNAGSIKVDSKNIESIKVDPQYVESLKEIETVE